MKTLLSCAAVLAATVGYGLPVAADDGHSYIVTRHFQSRPAEVVLDTVRADSPGWVNAVEYRFGRTLGVLGSAPVNHGVNTKVHVPMRAGHLGDVMVILYDQNGQPVASELIESRR